MAISLQPAPASAQKVRITGLADLAFGSINNFSADASIAQDVCVYSQASGYLVTATGAGPGGAFELASGSLRLPVEVQWSDSPGQTIGTALSPGVPLAGPSSAATQQTCNAGPLTSASLIVLLRAAALGAATSGSYSGTLTLIIAPN
ncbi:hypothetical protein ACFO0A_13910 [Novosphingobium tardum]|uniref:Uncharacterized protein n=1 Tax=Novosphingobium tardum TaxID=1538021 RepID=A0ABV8RRX0_9SPHN